MADYTQIIGWIKKQEGGLSKAKTDSASSHPVPDGSGFHTNKGVTWKTFESLGPKLGYSATPKLFYAMPDDIWGKIFKQGYWDVIRGDQIKSQALADTLADFAWGSGGGRAIQQLQKYLKLPQTSRMDDATLRAINSADERTLHTGFSAYKQAWYLSLPHQEANYAGWKNRLRSLYSVTVAKLGTSGSIVTVALLGTGLFVLLYLYSK